MEVESQNIKRTVKWIIYENTFLFTFPESARCSVKEIHFIREENVDIEMATWSREQPGWRETFW